MLKNDVKESYNKILRESVMPNSSDLVGDYKELTKYSGVGIQRAVSGHDYGHSVIGAAGFSYRDDRVFDMVYGLNSHNDGWFRRTEGQAAGYGLAIQDFRISSNKDLWAPENLVRSKNTDGNGNKLYYKRYKCVATVEYFDGDGESEGTSKETMYITIASCYTPEDILKYIKANKSKWKP